jgi:integrase
LAEVVQRRIERALEKASTGNLTADAAREIIREIYELATGDTLRSYTAEGWLREWLQGKEDTTAEGTFGKYEKVIGSFLSSLGERAKLNINQIMSRDVSHFRSARVADGLGPATANVDVSIIRMAFTAARKQGYIVHNPAEAVESLDETLPDDVEAVKRPFTIEEVQAILRGATGDWIGACKIGFYSGARLRDVANLRWRNVDLQNRWIEFRQIKTRKKTGGKVKLPMSEALHNYLSELPSSDNAEEFLFPSLAGRKSGGARGLSTEFAKIMERANVRGETTRQRRGKNSRCVNSLTFHSFRHTLTSILANAGVPAEVRSKFTGHASVEQNLNYTHHEIETLREAVEKLPSI